MIAIYGAASDPPTSAVIEALQLLGVPYAFVELAALDREHLRIDFGTRGVSGYLEAAGGLVRLSDIGSVFARPLDLHAHWSKPGGPESAWLLHEQFIEWLEVTNALVINRPSAMQSNGSKPLQMQLIGESGLRVPQSLVTNNPTDVVAFWHEHNRIIFKSTSGIRSIVQELNEDSAKRLHQIASLPTLFQEYVPGVDVRVHVVGTAVFAAEIESSVIDYRYAARDGAEVRMTAVDLPNALVYSCIELTRRLNLSVAGIDLRRRPDGEYVCFEVNPMPAYTYFESGTGQPIGRAIADLLVEADTWSQGGVHGTDDRKSHADHREGNRPQTARRNA